MILKEIKQAIKDGKTVCYSKSPNDLIEDWGDQGLHIVCQSNRYAIGLTWKDGTTMNGKPEDFSILEII